MQLFVRQNQRNLLLPLKHQQIKYFDQVLENIFQIKSSMSSLFEFLHIYMIHLSSTTAKQAAPTSEEDNEYAQKKKRKLAATSSGGTLNFSQW